MLFKIIENIFIMLFVIIRYQINIFNIMFFNIVDIQLKDVGGGGGEIREVVVYRLVDDMLEKLLQDYVLYEVRGVYRIIKKILIFYL